MKKMRKLPIEMSDIGNGNVTVHLTRVTSNVGYTHPWEIRIRDLRSDEIIVTVQLDADQASNLFAGLPAHAFEALFTTNPDAVGRRRVMRTVDVPTDLLVGTEKDKQAASEGWAENNCRPNERPWVRHNQRGWHVVFESWTDESEV